MYKKYNTEPINFYKIKPKRFNNNDNIVNINNVNNNPSNIIPIDKKLFKKRIS
jgi:uncharacterized protein (UPF0333 family)